MILESYSAVMAEEPPHIVLKLDTREPIELGAFVGAFASLGSEYDRFIKRTNPDLSGDAAMYVREVRAGCIEADLIPWLAVVAPFIGEMEKALIIEQFVRLWGSRFRALLTGVGPEKPESKSELRDWSDAVQAIANDPNGSAVIEAAVFEDGKKKVRAAFKFTSAEARAARQNIESSRRELEHTSRADHPRVLMRFTRSDVGDVAIGRRSGERVVIDEISDKPLALVYASELAEARIKHEIREADENVYKKAFVADVNVRSIAGRPVAYAVTSLHQVIDLPDDVEGSP